MDKKDDNKTTSHAIADKANNSGDKRQHTDKKCKTEDSIPAEKEETLSEDNKNNVLCDLCQNVPCLLQQAFMTRSAI